MADIETLEDRYDTAMILYDDGQFDKAFQLLEAIANEGYAQAQGKAGYCYYKGEGVKQDHAKAAEWWQKSAAQGYDYAKHYLEHKKLSDPAKGVICILRKRDPLEILETFERHRRYAKQGNADEQFSVGYHYENEEDYAKAAKWYTLAAEQENIHAYYKLGIFYENGYGVPQDYTKAAEWYRKAAEQGHVSAQYELGQCYYYGDGVTENPIKAAEWYRKAAEQGDSDAQCSLGCCYYDGEGVPLDYKEAEKWWRKAAEQGDDIAQDNLYQLKTEGKLQEQ